MNYSLLWSLLLGFVLGVAITTRCCDPSPSECEPLRVVEIVYDTIRITNPEPIAIEPISITPCEIVEEEQPEPLSLYTFADTTSGLWSAKVVGRDVELRELTLHNRVEYRTQTLYQPPTWEVMAQASVGGTTPYVGLNVAHRIGRMRISGFVGYNPYGGGVVVGGSFGVAIWRKY